MSIFAKTSFRLAPLVAGGLFVLAGLTAASAQTAAAADFTKFGFPTVAATANFTPGTATSGVARSPHSYRGGVRSSLEFQAMSQVISCPV